MSANESRPRRVLIASANPLFREGLRKVYVQRWGEQAELVGMTSSVDETIAAMETLKPDLVILDFDDRNINRGEFLNRFVTGQTSMKVVLVSLNEAGQVVVYDRRQLTSTQAEEWFKDPWGEETAYSAHLSREKHLIERRKSMRHIIILAVLIALSTVGVYSGLQAINLLPVQASTQAGLIDHLFQFQFMAISFLFSLIVVISVYSLIVFRRKKGETGDGQHFEGNTKLEITWTVIPLVTVLGMAYFGAQNLAATRQVAPDAMTVNVTGVQWAWSFSYPDYNVTSDVLYLPVNKQAVMRMTSLDVIHSFWVPEFRVKQDLVPGIETEYRITPDLIGDYKVRCAEMCGTRHAYMEAGIKVVSQEEFDTWITEQQKIAAAAEASGIPDATRGARLYQSVGCKGCHSTDGGKLTGPTWQGLYGSKVELTDGTVVTADEAYLTNSIINPSDQIVEGFAPGMPQFKLSELQVKDLIEYIKTLK